jgi:hypothetical protein
MMHKNYHLLVVLMLGVSVVNFANSLFAADNTTGQAARPAFVVVVHVSNPQTEFTRTEPSKLFLKKLKLWSQMNIPILPVDQLETAAVRAHFSEQILDKKIAAPKAVGRKRFFSGRNVPPPEKETDAEGVAICCGKCRRS